MQPVCSESAATSDRARGPRRRHLAKWEGLGRHGADARVRSALLADAGFGPRAVPGTDGWVVYEIAEGSAAVRRRLTAEGLDKLADYCAWRAATFERSAVDPALLNRIRRNGEIILGIVADGGSLPWSRCEVVRPVLADARMMPHEWVGREGSTWVKTDASLHGDDHLFPGPTDAAWDVAGAIAEWRMTSGEAEHFVARYRRRSGDDVAPRLAQWLVAYSLCRIAITEFAAATVDDAEKRRFLAEIAGYRRWMRSATQAFAGARGPRSR